MRCGCVVFDEQRPESGWASIEGEPATRIKGLGDLRSDVLWWTSLETTNFYHSGMSRIANMRNADYLRTPMAALKDEMGITQRFIEVNKSVSILSEVFSRVMLLAEMHYGIKQSKQQKLSDDLRTVLIPKDVSISEEMDQACELAYQAFVKCTKNPGRVKTKNVQFKRNRYQHAMEVLSTPVPGRKFEYVPQHKLPEKSDVMSWILELDRPVMIQGAVTHVSQAFSNVISFGGGSPHRRGWITHPEIVALSEFVHFDVQSLFLFDHYEPIKANIDPPYVDPGFGMLSISIGLLAENYWVGIASPEVGKTNTQKLYSPRVSWLRASDRSLTMIPAMKVHAEGVQVSSYSLGSVSIDVPYGNLENVMEIAGGAGLFPPLSSQEDVLIQEGLA